MNQAIWGKETLPVTEPRYYNILQHGANTWTFEFCIGEEGSEDCLFMNSNVSKMGHVPRLLYAHPRSLQYRTELAENTVIFNGKYEFLNQLSFKMLEFEESSKDLTVRAWGTLRRSWFRRPPFDISARCRFGGIMIFDDDRSKLEAQAEQFIAKHDEQLTLTVTESKPNWFKAKMQYPESSNAQVQA
jgi:hypothetical protein